MATPRHYRWTGEVDADWNVLGNWRVWNGVSSDPATALQGLDPVNFADHVGLYGFWADDANGNPEFQIVQTCYVGPTVGNAASLASVASDPDYANGNYDIPILFANVTAGELDAWDTVMAAGRVTGNATFSSLYMLGYMTGGQVDGNVVINDGAQILGGTIGGKVTITSSMNDCGDFSCDECEMTLSNVATFGVSANKLTISGGYLLGVGTVGELTCTGMSLDVYGGTVGLMTLFDCEIIGIGAEISLLRLYGQTTILGGLYAARVELMSGAVDNQTMPGDVTNIFLMRPEVAWGEVRSGVRQVGFGRVGS